MTEQLISFKTAKLAKEKDLEEGIEVNHTYTIGFSSIKPKREVNPFLPRVSVKNQFHLALAPTQSLLQKWLREEHNLYVNHLLSPAGIYIEIFKYGKCILTLGADGGYLNYEEALEAGLQEALKLI